MSRLLSLENVDSSRREREESMQDFASVQPNKQMNRGCTAARWGPSRPRRLPSALPGAVAPRCLGVSATGGPAAICAAVRGARPPLAGRGHEDLLRSRECRCLEMVHRCMPAYAWARRGWRKGKVAASEDGRAPTHSPMEMAAPTRSLTGHDLRSRTGLRWWIRPRPCWKTVADCVAARCVVERRGRGK
jgi:hypothetical protein